MTMGLRIELLRNPGCSHGVAAEAFVREVVGALAPEAELIVTEVRSEEEAAAARFAGSPTILVAGRDLDPAAVPSTGLG